MYAVPTFSQPTGVSLTQHWISKESLKHNAKIKDNPFLSPSPAQEESAEDSPCHATLGKFSAEHMENLQPCLLTLLPAQLKLPPPPNKCIDHVSHYLLSFHHKLMLCATTIIAYLADISSPIGYDWKVYEMCWERSSSHTKHWLATKGVRKRWWWKQLIYEYISAADTLENKVKMRDAQLRMWTWIWRKKGYHAHHRFWCTDLWTPAFDNK